MWSQSVVCCPQQKELHASLENLSLKQDHISIRLVAIQLAYCAIFNSEIITSSDCDAQCGENGGRFYEHIGLCECHGLQVRRNQGCTCRQIPPRNPETIVALSETFESTKNIECLEGLDEDSWNSRREFSIHSEVPTRSREIIQSSGCSCRGLQEI